MSFIRKYKKDGKTYLAEVKSVREDGKVTQKFIRYVGKEVDGETIITTSTKDLEVNEVKLQGPLLALNAICMFRFKRATLPFQKGHPSVSKGPPFRFRRATLPFQKGHPSVSKGPPFRFKRAT